MNHVTKKNQKQYDDTKGTCLTYLAILQYTLHGTNANMTTELLSIQPRDPPNI